MGAILSTIVLMSFIGVNNTVIVNVLILFIIVAVLSKKIVGVNNGIMLSLVVFAIFLNSNLMMQTLNIVENNRYSTIVVAPSKNMLENDFDVDGKIININRSNSGKYSPVPEKRFQYIQFIENNFINTLPKNGEKKKILVVGAGGFTVGIDDIFNDYTFVDIDSSLKKISEKYLLPPGKLGDNKKFDPQDARAFLNSSKGKYDLIILDAYSNNYDVPSYLLAEEFFRQVDSNLADGGIMLFNCATSALFASRYSIKIDNTLKKVFPNISRQIIGTFNGWHKGDGMGRNIIYMYFKKTILQIFTLMIKIRIF